MDGDGAAGNAREGRRRQVHTSIAAAYMMASEDPLVRIAKGQWRVRGALLRTQWGCNEDG
eukprot:SAG11_NODE_2207_length_3686_cov_7.684137_3_plen_60_part_00